MGMSNHIILIIFLNIFDSQRVSKMYKLYYLVLLPEQNLEQYFT